MESRTRQGCRALLNDAYLLPLILSGLRAYTLSLSLSTGWLTDRGSSAITTGPAAQPAVDAYGVTQR